MQLYKYDAGTLRYEQVKNRWVKPFAIAALIFMLLGFGTAVKVNTVVERIPVILAATPEPCTDDNVKEYIKELNLKFPKIVYQQAVVESNHYQSSVFKELNNLICMENARVRPTTGKDIGTRFAWYPSWKESLVDYALWQTSYAGEIKTEEQYYQLLDKLYSNHDLAENAGPLYSTRLKQIAWD